jgi:hypothetical protein
MSMMELERAYRAVDRQITYDIHEKSRLSSELSKVKEQHDRYRRALEVISKPKDTTEIEIMKYALDVLSGGDPGRDPFGSITGKPAQSS